MKSLEKTGYSVAKRIKPAIRKVEVGSPVKDEIIPTSPKTFNPPTTRQPKLSMIIIYENHSKM